MNANGQLPRIQDAIRKAESGQIQTWPEPLAEPAYHGIVGEFTRTLEPHTEADPVALAIQFAVYAGACIGRGPYYQVEGDRHYPNLFAVAVGRAAKREKAQAAAESDRHLKCSMTHFANTAYSQGYHQARG